MRKCISHDNMVLDVERMTGETGRVDAVHSLESPMYEQPSTTKPNRQDGRSRSWRIPSSPSGHVKVFGSCGDVTLDDAASPRWKSLQLHRRSQSARRQPSTTLRRDSASSMHSSEGKREGSGDVLRIDEDAADEGRCPSSIASEDSRCDLSALLASAAGLCSHRQQQQQQQAELPQSPSAASAGSAQTCADSPFAAVSGSSFSFDRAASMPSRLQPRARRTTSLGTWNEAGPAQRSSLSSDDCSSEMDADCCGDSGAITIKVDRALRRVGQGGRGVRGLPLRCNSLGDAIMHRPSEEDGEGSACGSSGGSGRSSQELPRRHSMNGISEGQAAVELFFRLNHARQTVDYVRRQATLYAGLSHARMGIWEALELLGSLREYEAPLLEEPGTDADLALPLHAALTAEACRAAFPDLDWLHLVGLIHSLGKLLAHQRLGGQPQWAVCGESFPVGCRHHPSIVCAQFFSVNPDRRRRLFNSSPCGMYAPGCGLASVTMSWSAPEYLHMVLALNRTRLPAEALFLIRHQRFNALHRPGQPYDELLCDADRNMVPWLARFMELSAYTRCKPEPEGGRLTGDAFREYYGGLIRKYIPEQHLRW